MRSDDAAYWQPDSDGVPPYIRNVAAKVYNDLPQYLSGPEDVTDAILNAIVPLIRADILAEVAPGDQPK
ncbi:hypothetical protein AB0D97_14225 [Streptomyces roseus]|uniref:hypothetical protein n=1 Tax=Streptomyces roseus TaxID=66430 RepID=UPI0033DBFEC3